MLIKTLPKSLPSFTWLVWCRGRTRIKFLQNRKENLGKCIDVLSCNPSLWIWRVRCMAHYISAVGYGGISIMVYLRTCYMTEFSLNLKCQCFRKLCDSSFRLLSNILATRWHYIQYHVVHRLPNCFYIRIISLYLLNKPKPKTNHSNNNKTVLYSQWQAPLPLTTLSSF